MPIQTPSPDSIADAAAALNGGRLVAFPTETVYGLGADAGNARAVAMIYEAKGRPRFNPLIAHVADAEAAARLAVLGPAARLLAAAFWPGPLTLVLPCRAGAPIADLVTAGLDTIAIRVPAHPVAVALLKACRCPVAAPSANRSGHVSPTLAEHVAADLGEGPALILDGGPTTHGLESTILDASSERIALLRPGAVPAEAIEAVLRETVARPALAAGAQPTAPGQLASHYAPRARLRLGVTVPEPGEALVAFGAVPPTSGPVIQLSATGDLVEAAANLFVALRRLDELGAPRAAVAPIPRHGLGEAINDRLNRAAAPRN